MSEKQKTIVTKSHDSISGVSRFAVGDYGIFYNCIQHQREGGRDLPEGNGKYWQRAKVIAIREDRYGDEIADVTFDSGLTSMGHFTRWIEHCD